MNILSNKRYDELVEAKKLGIPYGSCINAIYDVIDKYFSEIGK